MVRAFILGVIVAILAAAGCIYLLLAKGVVPASADSGPLPLESWATGLSLHATLAKEAPQTPNPVPLN